MVAPTGFNETVRVTPHSLRSIKKAALPSEKLISASTRGLLKGPRMIVSSKNMKTMVSLTGSHLRTHNTIFQHPVSHNLQWHDVYALFRHLGQVEEEPNGHLKVTRNGQTLMLHPPHGKDVSDTSEVMSLRHFLEKSDQALPEANVAELHWLLVIDHHDARIYRSEIHGSIPQRILPLEPEAHLRLANDAKDFSRGKDKPDPNSFFKPLASVLQGGGQILIFGTGIGTSSEMEQFIAWFKLHHPDQAKRIIGSLVVDESHLTDDQLLAKARDFYAQAAKPKKDNDDKLDQNIPNQVKGV
jgi:hypothetical protein